MTDQQQAQAAVASGITFVVTIGVIILYVVPALITFWQLYAKAHKPGWSAIIPVYSSMVMAEIAEMPMWLGITVGVAALLSSWIRILGLVELILGLWLLNGFIKKYDRGLGFWFLVIFFPFIAVFLAKNANYKGPQPLGPNATAQGNFPPQGPTYQQPPVASPAQTAQPVQPVQPAGVPVQNPQPVQNTTPVQQPQAPTQPNNPVQQ